MSAFKRSICIDFDGVLHAYTSGWQGIHVAADPPVPGALTWLRELIGAQDIQPCIYSSRSKDPRGKACMINWLYNHGMSMDEVAQLAFPTEKPAAWLTIDDRAICFEGTFPRLDVIRAFKPWNKRAVRVAAEPLTQDALMNTAAFGGMLSLDVGAPLIEITNHVRLHQDGRIDVLSTPDAAARAFWAAVQTLAPAFFLKGEPPHAPDPEKLGRTDSQPEAAAGLDSDAPPPK